MCYLRFVDMETTTDVASGLESLRNLCVRCKVIGHLESYLRSTYGHNRLRIITCSYISL